MNFSKPISPEEYREEAYKFRRQLVHKIDQKLLNAKKTLYSELSQKLEEEESIRQYFQEQLTKINNEHIKEWKILDNMLEEVEKIKNKNNYDRFIEKYMNTFPNQ